MTEPEELTDQEMGQVRLCTMLEEIKESETLAELDVLVGLMSAEEEQLFERPILQRRAALQREEEIRKEALAKFSKADLLKRVEELEGKMSKLKALEKRKESERVPKTNDHVRYVLTEVGKEWDPVTPQKVALLAIMRSDDRDEWTEPELFDLLLRKRSMLHGRQSPVKVFKYYRGGFEEAGAIEIKRG